MIEYDTSLYKEESVEKFYLLVVDILNQATEDRFQEIGKFISSSETIYL